MCHFKATHEPFDYPDRFSQLYQDQKIPFPRVLLGSWRRNNRKILSGQSIDNLQKRYLDVSENPEHKRDFQHYPDLPFSVDGLDADEARMKTYQKFVKDFMRCGAAIDDNIGKLMAYLEEAGLAENTHCNLHGRPGLFPGGTWLV